MRPFDRWQVVVLVAMIGIVLGGLLSQRGTDLVPGSLNSAADKGGQGASGGSGKASDKASGASSDKGSIATAKRRSEVQSESQPAGATGLPGISGKKAGNGPLIEAPLPATASKEGGIVAGFPAGIIPVATGSSVTSSGVSSAGSRLQVSIVATSSKSPEWVLKFYRSALGKSGFESAVAPAVGGSTAATFIHSVDSLVITATRTKTSLTTYSVFGTLNASSSR